MVIIKLMNVATPIVKVIMSHGQSWGYLQLSHTYLAVCIFRKLHNTMQLMQNSIFCVNHVICIIYQFSQIWCHLQNLHRGGGGGGGSVGQNLFPYIIRNSQKRVCCTLKKGAF